MQLDPDASSLTLAFLLILMLLSFGEEVRSADNYTINDFPANFIFGSGSTAYQVEGAANEDGRTPSIWDTFAHAGNADGATGDVACDEYHKYKEDVQLMVETGLDAYRFSISWSRLVPNGRGPTNPKGLQYYNNLIDELLSNGIQPHVTLHNFDLPQALEDAYGGWVSRDIIKDFRDYADVCFREFGDRVKYWNTVNEPNVFALGGYDQGALPPQRCSPPFGLVNCTKGNSTTEPYLVVHHVMLAHSSAVRLYRRKYRNKQQGFVGISVYTYACIPQTKTEKDVLAVKRADDFLVGWVLEPLVYGDYPASMKANAGARIPAFTDRESKQVRGSCDFIGLIYYTTANVSDNQDSLKQEFRDIGRDMAANIIFEADLFTEEEYPIKPWGIRHVLETFKLLYGNPPVFIYENGQRTARNTSLEDVSRVKYLHAHIGGVLDALRNGSNTRGYFAWSFLDLLELLDGYKSGFGLYYVDLDDPHLKRYPKLSAKWYSRFLRARNASSIVSPTHLHRDEDPSLLRVAHLFQ
ncbi:hydroxyisourate hydrolase [Neltuma alba]|uniref:hydroxyisourate hydrolase n=1 Tax=Neltuma alba TaxID=207710 RepID=UPI0010A4F96D|nr:hydroxyisourate hydrolase [Prosopis alba]